MSVIHGGDRPFGGRHGHCCPCKPPTQGFFTLESPRADSLLGRQICPGNVDQTTHPKLRFLVGRDEGGV